MEQSPPAAPAQFWVERDSYHTAVLLPKIVVQNFAPELKAVLDEKSFVRFGWGDRDYYGSSTKNFYKLFKALFLPTRSVMEVSTFDSVAEAGTLIVAITQHNVNMHALLRFISNSFYLHQQHGPELVRTETTGFRYYRGRGIYFAGKNCNNWTAKALQHAGLKVWYWRAFFAEWVMRQVV